MRTVHALVLLGSGLAGCRSFSAGRGSYEQTYYAAPHNWSFRNQYPQADRLFNGFDFGHAILYETLLTSGTGPTLDAEYRHLTVHVLRHPPSVPLEERAIGPTYATLIPEVVAMFDWAHMLHRQLYDILSDEHIAPDTRRAYANQVLGYYHSRPDLALSAQPKSMDLMEGQPYSMTFRRAAPQFNGLIWSYHWLQMVIYDALISTPSREERSAHIDAAIAHFHAMNDGTDQQPSVMPMSAAIAPLFSAKFPDAAAVFDNLHALHDVISDILASRQLSRAAKREAALTAAARYRDAVTAVISHEAWLEMSRAMGVDMMGGPLP